MRFAPTFLPLNAAAYALLTLAPLVAYSQDAVMPDAHSIVVSSEPGVGSVGCPDGETSCGPPSSAAPKNNTGGDASVQPTDKKMRDAKPADFTRDIYYRNKLEFALDVGWLPINIPFPFDVFESDSYTTYPLKYTLVPVIGSLRWHLGGPSGPSILRGNWDLTFSGSATAIPRGPETRYFSYD